MTERLRIGVMGAGSIGVFVGGRLLAADAARVTLVGRQRLVDEVGQHGLVLQDLDDPPRHVDATRVSVKTDASALRECDVVLVATKSAQTEDAARALAAVLDEKALIVSLQNGVRNPDVLRRVLAPRVVQAAIVDFNVVSRGDGLFHRGLLGPLVVERVAHPRAAAWMDAARRAGLVVREHDDLRPAQWTKLLVNLNNAVSALSDAPTQTLVHDPAYRRVIAALMREALVVLRAKGIRPAKLRGVPVALMPVVLSLPTPLVKLIVGRQAKMNPDARSSMWEDLSRRRPTEVDYLNGEIVRLSDETSALAPLHRRIVALVHEAERADRGSPGWSGEELWARLRAP